VCYYPVGSDNLQSVNFGFSYNKTKDFNRNYSASGRGMKTSLTDYIENITYGVRESDLLSENAYNISGVPWLSILAVDADLIKRGDNGDYISLLDFKELVDPRLNVTEKGYIDNYDFTLGLNFSNAFYIGMTLSMTDVYYRMDSRYGEIFKGELGDGFLLDNYLQTEGSGWKIDLGAIWRPVDFLRLGIAYHSPTWLALKDFYQGTMNDSQGYRLAWTADANSDYRFRTPYSWVFSAAGILGTKAIVSLDYEIKDYRSMNFDDQYLSASSGFEAQNKDIDKKFEIASTVRAGLEYRFTPQFSGRLGYSLMQNPYKKDVKDNKVEIITAGTIPHYTIEGNVNYFTAGIGYRFTPNFYIDAAFVYRTQKDDSYFFPYIETNRPDQTNDPVSYFPVAASFTNTSYKGLVTLGYKF
jgi:opacity protein-like surface antigen